MTTGEILILSEKSLIQKTARLVYEKYLIFPSWWGPVDREDWEGDYIKFGDIGQLDLIRKSKNLAKTNSSATPVSWSPTFGESMRTTRLVPLMKLAPGKSGCPSVGVMVKSRIWPCFRRGVSLNVK